MSNEAMSWTHRGACVLAVAVGLGFFARAGSERAHADADGATLLVGTDSARRLSVLRVEPSEHRPVFNFTVEDTHTYFVGRVAGLAHNVSPSGLCPDGYPAPLGDAGRRFRKRNGLDDPAADDGFLKGHDMGHELVGVPNELTYEAQTSDLFDVFAQSPHMWRMDPDLAASGVGFDPGDFPPVDPFGQLSDVPAGRYTPANARDAIRDFQQLADELGALNGTSRSQAMQRIRDYYSTGGGLDGMVYIERGTPYGSY